MEVNTQLSFNLSHADPYSLEFFVMHSGVAQAYTILEQSFRSVMAKNTEFCLIYLYGPKGSGKSHLAHGFAGFSFKAGFNPKLFGLFELDQLSTLAEDQTEQWISNFISEYERLKTGGIILICCAEHPTQVTDNPHLSSRLVAGNIVRTNFPNEQELKPVITSILERYNLKFSEKLIEYLLKRVPLSPLCFAELFATIDRISLEQGVPIGPRLMKKVLESKKRL